MIAGCCSYVNNYSDDYDYDTENTYGIYFFS